MTTPTITLGGQLSSALWHFCGYGLASVLEEAGVYDVRLWWEDAAPSVLHVSGAEPDEIDVAVREHAKRATDPSHWVQAQLSGGTRAGVSLFSPRVKPAASRGEWQQFLRERGTAMDRVTSRLDEDMIAGLGMPAHWRDERNANPDAGASRWEMKTRNRGEEFVTHRLRPLAAAVANRPPGQIVEALTGHLLIDDAGGNPSRTPTGFTLPQRTDSAVAWLALWGMCWFPVAQSTTQIAATACSHPRKTHPEQMALPVLTRPTKPGKWRRILRGRSLAEASFGHAPAAARALAEHGVIGIVRFPIRVEGSASAPERLILDGGSEPFP